jgi:GntR family transcriptional regulator
MHLAIDPHCGLPTYRQLVDQIRLHVTSGALPPGTELPSTRALAQRLGINPMTISKAYALLEAEGVLRHRPGLALTVNEQSAHALDAAREAQLLAAVQPAAHAAVQLGVSASRVSSMLRDVMADLRRQQLSPLQTSPRKDSA